MLCRICGNSQNNKTLIVREMMFGFKDEFTYFECSVCGCLQIAEIPRDMAKYYPTSYYSFRQPTPETAIRRFFTDRRDKYAAFGTGLVGRLVSLRHPNTTLAVFGDKRPDHEARVLDVGCGAGAFLWSLQNLGFNKLFGVDPYIAGDVAAGPVQIYKKTILDMPDCEKFDFVFFNHSLEHIWNQKETLSKAGRLLAPAGVCVVRMPIKTETVWNLYGTDWIQIDAPRHFHIHTVSSFSILSRQVGLVVRSVTFDSSEFQFWGSEQYRRGIPLEAEDSFYVNPKNSIFTAAQMKGFRRRARELNTMAEGDQAAFCLAVGQ